MCSGGLLSPDGISVQRRSGLIAWLMADPGSLRSDCAPARAPASAAACAWLAGDPHGPVVDDHRGESEERDEGDGDMNDDGAAFGLKLHTGRTPRKTGHSWCAKVAPTKSPQNTQKPAEASPGVWFWADFGRLPDHDRAVRGRRTPAGPFPVGYSPVSYSKRDGLLCSCATDRAQK